MCAWFERLVDPFPPTLPQTPPARFWPFMWAATEGLRGYIDVMAQALESDRPAAHALMSELVGALSLARSVAREDRALSDGILEAAKARVLARL